MDIYANDKPLKDYIYKDKPKWPKYLKTCLIHLVTDSSKKGLATGYIYYAPVPYKLYNAFKTG